MIRFVSTPSGLALDWRPGRLGRWLLSRLGLATPPAPDLSGKQRRTHRCGPITLTRDWE